MLVITTETDDDSTTFQLKGDLTGPAVSELEKQWRQTTNPGPGLVHLDLRQVSNVDDSGKQLLNRMFGEGIEFVVRAQGLHPAGSYHKFGAHDSRTSTPSLESVGGRMASKEA